MHREAYSPHCQPQCLSLRTTLLTVAFSSVGANGAGKERGTKGHWCAVLKEYVVLVARKRAAKDAAWKEFHDAVLAALK